MPDGADVAGTSHHDYTGADGGSTDHLRPLTDHMIDPRHVKLDQLSFIPDVARHNIESLLNSTIVPPDLGLSDSILQHTSAKVRGDLISNILRRSYNKLKNPNSKFGVKDLAKETFYSILTSPLYGLMGAEAEECAKNLAGFSFVPDKAEQLQHLSRMQQVYPDSFQQGLSSLYENLNRPSVIDEKWKGAILTSFNCLISGGLSKIERRLGLRRKTK